MKAFVPLLALALALTPLSIVHPVRVQGSSMEPAFPSGSLAWVLRAWLCDEPTVGEVWLVNSPEGPVLKRVLAPPRARLEQRLGLLFRDGEPLVEPWTKRPECGDAGPWLAGEGYLLLGDNRAESRDSRAWGPLPRRAFRGRVLGDP